MAFEVKKVSSEVQNVNFFETELNLIYNTVLHRALLEVTNVLNAAGFSNLDEGKA